MIFGMRASSICDFPSVDRADSVDLVVPGFAQTRARRWLRSRVRSASTDAMSRPVALAPALTASHSASDARACSASSFHFGSVGVVISSRMPSGSWK